MPYISSSYGVSALLLMLSLCGVLQAQQQVNPATQIRWPAITGTIDPAAPAWPCGTATYGEFYTNLTSGTVFSCSSSGWTSVGSGVIPAFSTLGASIALTGTEAASLVPVGTSSSTAVLRQLTQDDILPGFTISSFTGGSTVEVGATVTNPSFTAAYSSTPASASITNTDGIDSPHALTTPFTSGTITGTFTKTTVTSTTFTLSAVNGVTKTATSAISWLPRTFGGVGAASATSSVSASGTTAVLSNGAVLASLGLSASQVGSTFGPFSPSGQKIYLLLIGSTHTFKDASTGFAFVFNTPTAVSFVNINGTTIAMYLYESTNTLTGSFSIQVVS